MAKLPAVTARQVLRVLKRAGFVEERQKGSHVILFHPQKKTRTVVPVHSGKTLKRPLLKAILNDAGLTLQEFLDLM
jgi:predicted RNA binding protein YcfA (HicA-like mRNA interferase family)